MLGLESALDCTRRSSGETPSVPERVPGIVWCPLIFPQADASRSMLGRMIAAIKIVPSEDGAYTVVSEDERVWRKKYASMDDATSEAAELEIMTPYDKQLADLTQPVPTYAQGFTAPEVEVDLRELEARGFRLDA
jgi:hypothetical protein